MCHVAGNYFCIWQKSKRMKVDSFWTYESLSVMTKIYYKFTLNICNTYNDFCKHADFFFKPYFINSKNHCMFMITLKLLQKVLVVLSYSHIAHHYLLISEPALTETYFSSCNICIVKYNTISVIYHKLFIHPNICYWGL